MHSAFVPQPGTTASLGTRCRPHTGVGYIRGYSFEVYNVVNDFVSLYDDYSKMYVGLRVVRGPKWDYDEEIDGGEGFVGTVVAVGSHSSSLPEKLVKVQWDCGTQHHHRAGFHGACDLYIFDSSPTGVNHENIGCGACNQNPILGIRWRCVSCRGLNLCTSCYMSDKHDKEHRFQRIDEPGSVGREVGTRQKSRKIEAKGIFPGAKVKRGLDWKYGDQDGGIGQWGFVQKLTNWRDKPNTAVVVRWHQTQTGKYRLGYKGKVDIVCTTPKSGGWYYKEHLRKLGEPIEMKQKSQYQTRKSHPARKKESTKDLEVGDEVRIDMSMEDAMSIHEDSFGWAPDMENCIGKVGIVHSFEGNNGVNILFDKAEQPWTFDVRAVSKVNTQHRQKGKDALHKDDIADKSRVSVKHASASSGSSAFEERFCPGVKVRVMADEERVKHLQVGHGVQDKLLCNTLGKVGVVKEVDMDGDIEVQFDDKKESFTFNPAVLIPIKGEGRTDADKETGAALTSEGIMPMYLDEGSIQDGKSLVSHASQGRLNVVQHLLGGLTNAKRALVVNYLAGGHTALHQACHSGHAAVVETLLWHGASLQLQDSQGYSALHHASYGDYSGSMTALLIKEGADIDDNRNSVMSTPLHLAVNQHNTQAALVLIQHGCDVNLVDLSGRTPLHYAVKLGNSHMVETILKTKPPPAAAVVDLRICDNDGLNPFHLAAQKKFASAVKQMISYSEEIVNVKESNGFTSLHLSVLKNDVETAKVLLESGCCNVKATSHGGATAADLASSAGNGLMLDLLADYDAEIHDSVATETAESMASSTSSDLQTHSFQSGDQVFLKVKGEALKALQIGHGGWNFEMSLVSEKIGSVIEVMPTGDVYVFFEHLLKAFIFNPATLKLQISQEDDSTPALECTVAGGIVRRKELYTSVVGIVAEKNYIFPLDKSEDDVSAILFHAICTSNQSSIRNILEVYPDKVNCTVSGKTPLHMACKGGSVDVLRILLECTRPKARVEAKDDSGFTPLHYAALGDQSGLAAEMLLNVGASVNAHNNKYRTTPLQLAVMCCNEGTFKVLLGQQEPSAAQGISCMCDVNLQNCCGDTALHEAVRTGKGGFAEIMLRLEDINVELHNCNGLNPFHIAVLDGNEMIVKMMLSWKPNLVNTYTAGDDGMAPLHLSCWKAHCGVAQILLDVEHCDIRARDFQDRTALAIASAKKLNPVVRRLLEVYDSRRTGSVRIQASERIDKGSAQDTSATNKTSDVLRPNFYKGDIVKVRESKEIVSSLQYRHQIWRDEMQKTLGEIGRILKIDQRGDVEVMFEELKETFLYHPSTLIFICEQNESESQPLQYPDDGETTEEQQKNTEQDFALSRIYPFRNEDEDLAGELLQAATMNHALRVRYILQKAPDLVDYRQEGYTALHLACRKGFENVIKVLLEEGANSSLPDDAGLYPLHVSAAFDRSGISVSLLSDHKANFCVTTDTHAMTALHLAVLTNNEASAKSLIKGGCDVNAKDTKGKTALQYAITQEKNSMLETILAAPLLDILLHNEKGFNPLHEAVEVGNAFAIGKIASRYPSCIDVPNIDGSTALHLAVLSNRREIIQLLLKTESINVNAVNSNNDTPLQLAISQKLQVAADLLLNHEVSEKTGEVKPKTDQKSCGGKARIELSASMAETDFTESSTDDNEEGCVKEQSGKHEIPETSHRVFSKKIESEDESDQISWQFPQTFEEDSTSDTSSADATTLPYTTAKTQTLCDLFSSTNSVEKICTTPVTITSLIKPQKENETVELVSSQEKPSSPEESVEFRGEEPSDSHLNPKQDITGKTGGPAIRTDKTPKEEKNVMSIEKRKDVPNEFFCPISNEVMKDPVIAADGFSYEREEIESWLKSGKCTSPMTNERLDHNALIPNRSLRTLIQKQQMQSQ